MPVMMPNRPEFVASWFALYKLGAVATLINTATRGPGLIHVLNLSGAQIAVVDQSLTGSLEVIRPSLHRLSRLVVPRDRPDAGDLAGFDTIEFPIERHAAATSICTHRVVDELDPAMVMFTSGTTGPSKGCVLSHRYAVRQAELMIEHLELRPDDVLYCPFPLFHLDATVLTVMPALVLATTAAIGRRFSVSGFWHEVRQSGATVFDFMGATLTMLHKVPRAIGDEHNPCGWRGACRSRSSPKSSRRDSGCDWLSSTARPTPESRCITPSTSHAPWLVRSSIASTTSAVRRDDAEVETGRGARSWFDRTSRRS